MKLSPQQIDALTEMMNIATGRAAASLSMILRQHVKLFVMEIRTMLKPEIKQFLETEVGAVGSVVEQKFSGGLIGNSLMIMTHDNAETLVQTLLQQNKDLASLTSTDQTILAEVGNIVLNAYVSMFANQTGRRLYFSLPKVGLNILGSQLAVDLTSNWGAHVEGLVMKSHLLVGHTQATIYILILMTMDAETIQALIEEALRRILES